MLDDIIQTDKELDLVGKAKNGEEMCQIIKDRQPDVVLLDLIMPKMDGLTVMEQVNKQEFVDKRPYFIVLTAVGQEKITEDAFNKGANYYIMKPLIIRFYWIGSNRSEKSRRFLKRKMKRVYRKFHQDGKIWKAE